jgi:RNA recognition motif-containing protein
MNHKRLYVGDLAPDVTEEDLHDLFSELGNIEAVQLMRNANHQLHGFAFIEMASSEAARDAVRQLNGHSLKGGRLIVYTVPPKSKPRSASSR